LLRSCQRRCAIATTRSPRCQTQLERSLRSRVNEPKTNGHSNFVAQVLLFVDLGFGHGNAPRYNWCSFHIRPEVGRAHENVTSVPEALDLAECDQSTQLSVAHGRLSDVHQVVALRAKMGAQLVPDDCANEHLSAAPAALKNPSVVSMARVCPIASLLARVGHIRREWGPPAVSLLPLDARLLRGVP
jgi:hypothetical protein